MSVSRWYDSFCRIPWMDSRLGTFTSIFYSALHRGGWFPVHLVVKTVPHLFVTVLFLTAHLCYKQGSISEQTRAKQHTICWLANNCSLPPSLPPYRNIWNSFHSSSRVESVKKNGIMFVDKPRTGDPVTVLTTHVDRENCPLYSCTCQRWF